MIEQKKRTHVLKMLLKKKELKNKLFRSSSITNNELKNNIN